MTMLKQLENLVTIDEDITNPEYGVREVDIDAFQDLQYTVDRSRNYGGISKVDLTTKMARSKLRDPNTIANALVDLIENSSKRKNIQRSAWSNYKFSAKNAAIKTISVREGLLS